MTRKSAGILLYRNVENQLYIFIVHPGGPFWKNKDLGAWSIPKGEYGDDENPRDAATRELKEETGIVVSGDFIELSPVKLKSGKVIQAWAIESDAEFIKCDSFIKIEWPPKTGKYISIPEVDKGEWFTTDEAKQKINPAQTGFINELIDKLK